MICHNNPTTKIYVGDANPDDYADVVADAVYESIQFRFFESGREALRHNPDDEPEMWVVNMDLADMEGSDLYSMLQTRGTSCPILLVSDEYSVEGEMKARMAGACMYFAKPLQGEWILETKAGAPAFHAQRRRERQHGVEEIGKKLRKLMSWIDEKEVD